MESLCTSDHSQDLGTSKNKGRVCGMGSLLAISLSMDNRGTDGYLKSFSSEAEYIAPFYFVSPDANENGTLARHALG